MFLRKQTTSLVNRVFFCVLLPRNHFFVEVFPLHPEGDFCYNGGISSKTNMNIDSCIAHALHKDLDILEAVPSIRHLPMEKLEESVEKYVNAVQESLKNVVAEQGEKFIRARDAAGLCAACLDAGVQMPPRMLLKVCQTIVQMRSVDAVHVMNTLDGESLFYMKMQVEIPETALQ
jgi:hypothetical protein